MVSALELARWRENSRQEAIALGIPPEEADWLLKGLAGINHLDLRLASNSAEISLRIPFSQLKQLWEKRLQERIPVQYLVGETPWRDFLLKVSPDVLIPRPETELIPEIALNHGNNELKKGHWVDLGTGSGAIALSLVKVLPEATIHAVDNSSEAIAIAKENAQRHDLETRIQFHQGSWFSPLTHFRGRISAMVSNPPYIPTDILAELQPEVANHEPKTALDGGKDGLDAIRHLIDTAPEFLQNGGLWLIEIEARQGKAVQQLLQENGNYHKIEIRKDLAGIDRFALAEVRKSPQEHYDG